MDMSMSSCQQEFDLLQSIDPGVSASHQYLKAGVGVRITNHYRGQSIEHETR
jgi:hypothetical protein